MNLKTVIDLVEVLGPDLKEITVSRTAFERLREEMLLYATTVPVAEAPVHSIQVRGVQVIT